MLKKINLIIILTGSCFVFLVTTGIKKIHISTQSKIYEAFINNDSSKYEELTDLTFGELLVQQHLWTLAFAVLAVSIVFLFNWRANKPTINSFIVLLVTFGLFPSGLINGDNIPIWFNSFCYLFSSETGKAFLIGGSILCISGTLILYVGNKTGTNSIIKD